jgi:hypothetical protein
MHRFNTVLIAALAALQTGAFAQTGTAKFSADQVSFYSVPLACPAARGLGCGSAAKPVLSALEDAADGTALHHGPQVYGSPISLARAHEEAHVRIE